MLKVTDQGAAPGGRSGGVCDCIGAILHLAVLRSA